MILGWLNRAIGQRPLRGDAENERRYRIAFTAHLVSEGLTG